MVIASAPRPFPLHLRSGLLIAACLGATVAHLPARADMNEPLESRLTSALVRALFPDSDGIAGIEGDPPVAPVRKDGEIIGYLFSTHETVRPAGYSGNSFDIVVALGADGVIKGHRLLEEHEPLISPGMIPPSNFRHFLSQVHGKDVRTDRRFLPRNVDAVSGATISAMAMARAMLDSAVLIGHREGLIDDGGNGLSLDIYEFSERSWPELVADGSIGSMKVTNREVRTAFDGKLGGNAEPTTPFGPDDEPYMTVYAAVATPPTIGRNLFGARAFRQITRTARPGEQQLLLASTGPYKWLPKNPWLVAEFDRARIVQGGLVLPLRPEHFYRARRLAIEGYPELTNAGRVALPAASGFDPLEPWSLRLRAFEALPDGGEPRYVEFELRYRIPARYVLGERAALEDAGFAEPTYVGFGLWRESSLTDWQHIWVAKRWSVLGLLALLVAVTSVMLFQHGLTRHRRHYVIVRAVLLVATLVWLGWVAGAQLSILTVINYGHLLLADMDWRSALFDPLLVVLSGYVVLTLLLWGRGVFCGWLCPFGALQELLNKAGRAVRVPQLTVPPSVQARLWSLKYAVLLGIAGLAFYSLNSASIAAEIEPFKTAISLHFRRAWPYVVYAGLLLAAGLVVERFFCRYLCPLGALLAIGGRLRLLNWLKRRPECGNPCRICERSCPIGAIDASGTINMNECLQCLDCQAEYHDDRRCPPLAAARRAADGFSQAAPAPAGRS